MARHRLQPRVFLPVLAITLAGAAATTTPPPSSVTVDRTAWLMGTRARIGVEGDTKEQALAASEAALGAMSTAESLLSTWRDDSALTRVNRTTPGDEAWPKPELATLLSETARWSRLTGGAFDPAVGALVDAWDLRGSGRVPTSRELDDALASVGNGGISIDPVSGSIVRHSADAWLDAGAFGKGAALRAAAVALRHHGVAGARIDLGGQILAIGDEPVRVGIADPRSRRTSLFELDLVDGSVATSGQSERGIEVDGRRYGHLLDPRDGRPVAAWGSVTVVHPDPFVADILATALFVLGPEDGLELAGSLDDVAALFLVSTDAGVSERMTSAMRERYAIRSIDAASRGMRSSAGLPASAVTHRTSVHDTRLRPIRNDAHHP